MVIIVLKVIVIGEQLNQGETCQTVKIQPMNGTIANLTVEELARELGVVCHGEEEAEVLEGEEETDPSKADEGEEAEEEGEQKGQRPMYAFRSPFGCLLGASWRPLGTSR